jgi:hypothetical protein
MSDQGRFFGGCNIWMLPSMYMLMYLEVTFVTECFITHHRDMYVPQYVSHVKKKKGGNITILKRGKKNY